MYWDPGQWNSTPVFLSHFLSKVLPHCRFHWGDLRGGVWRFLVLLAIMLASDPESFVKPKKDFRRSAFLRWRRFSCLKKISAYSLNVLSSDNPNSWANGRGYSASNAEEVGKRMRLGLGGNAEQCGVSAVVAGIMATAVVRRAFLSKLLTKVTVGFCTTAYVPSSSSFSSGKEAATGGLPRIFFVNWPNECNTCLTRASFNHSAY